MIIFIYSKAILTSRLGLIAKLKLPDQKLLSSEEKESYRVYRIDISDTLMYIYNLLNQAMLQFMADAVCNVMAKANFDWRDVEAILFCFYSIVESCEPEGNFIRKVSTDFVTNINLCFRLQRSFQ